VRLSAEGRGRARKARQKSLASVGVSPPIFSFFRSYPFVIRAEAALANASTGIGLLRLGVEHRMKSVVTVHNSGLP
jgi:hypothetical protein